jgi:hypothetical protein
VALKLARIRGQRCSRATSIALGCQRFENPRVLPLKVIDATQAWFWQPERQAGEREAAADLAAGRSLVLDSSEALLASLGE